MTRITIVGSRQLQNLPHAVLTMMQLLFPKDTEVLLRHPLHQPPNRFEMLTAYACDHLGIPHRWMRPEPGGRGQVFNRDITMVGMSDLVLAFFAEDEMSGGTEHVVEKAIDQRVPVYSFGIREERLVLVGSSDLDDAWGAFTI